ncbi:MAG: hypothetical protein WCF93_00145 [Candidatus Moraniibacteriota bacterium]
MITKFFNLFRTRKRKIRDNFIIQFGFSPEKLSKERCKKEALLKLLFYVAALKKNAGLFQNDPTNYFWQRDYEESLAIYEYAFSLLNVYQPAFCAKIPHWTEFPAWISQWLEGKWDDVEVKKILDSN